MSFSAPRNAARSAAVGIATAVLTGAVTAPLFKTGVTPMPQAPSQAFAETLAGPLPGFVGMFLHLAYVTTVASLFLALVGARPRKTHIAGLSLGLWLVALSVFFPLAGWGFAGLAISPRIAVAAIGPHVLFGLVLWGASRFVGAREPAPGGAAD